MVFLWNESKHAPNAIRDHNYVVLNKISNRLADLTNSLAGLATWPDRTSWRVCNPSWWLVWKCFIPALSGWNCNSPSLSLTLCACMLSFPKYFMILWGTQGYANSSHFHGPNCFSDYNLQVIYAGLLVASGGADLTIWLLFGFVV